MADVLIVLMLASAFAVGTLLLIRHERRVDYAPPAKGVRPGVYQRFEETRRALFRNSRQVRFTIFGRDPNAPDVLRPIARMGWGRASAHSDVRFRIGEGLAGKAWKEPGTIWVAQLGAFDSIAAARRAQQEVLHLGPDTASALSEEQALRANVLIAAAIESGRWFRGVLCIDCLDASLVPGRDDVNFWVGIEKLALALAPLIPTIEVPRVEMRDLESVAGATLKQVHVELGAL